MLHSTTQLVALDLPLCCTFSLQQGLFFFYSTSAKTQGKQLLENRNLTEWLDFITTATLLLKRGLQSCMLSITGTAGFVDFISPATKQEIKQNKINMVERKIGAISPDRTIKPCLWASHLSWSGRPKRLTLFGVQWEPQHLGESLESWAEFVVVPCVMNDRKQHINWAGLENSEPVVLGAKWACRNGRIKMYQYYCLP